MDEKEQGLVKEGMMAVEMRAGQMFGIELKAQESGSFSNAFLLLKESTECFFLLFLFGMRNMRGGKQRCAVIDSWIRT